MMDGIRPVGTPPATTDTTAAKRPAAPETPAATPAAATPDGRQASGARSGSAVSVASLIEDKPAAPPERKGPKPVTERQGRLFASWGYNRAAYAPSTIHFKSGDGGQAYDFTLHNVKASDRPTFQGTGDFATRVWKTPLTIPQYNFRIGYFLNDKTSLSLGIDHMKYVMDGNQSTTMSGHVSPEASASFGGDHSHTPVTLGTGQSIVNGFEHTDGFNLIDIEVGHTETLAASKDGRHAVSFFGTVGAGAMVPKTNVTLMGKQLDNKFHLAGYGLSASAGVRADIFRYGFIEGKLKGGYVDVMNALTVEGGKASHQVLYLQPSISVGVNVPIGK